MVIKAVCLDIYGTVLATDDHDQNFPPRQGLREFFDICDKRRIRVIATSDESIEDYKRNLEICFNLHDRFGLTIDRFFDFYRLGEAGPKDYSLVARSFGIDCSEILVIGDGPKDFFGARKHGCPLIICPEYTIEGGREFDFSKIPFDEINMRETKIEQSI